MFTGSCMCNSFLAELWQAVHNFSSNGDVFMLALYDATATLTASTSVYPASGGEITGTGYTAGGATVPTSLGVASGGPISFPQFLPVTWAANLTAAGGLIYNSTKGNRAVCVFDFGGTRAANPFTVNFPANGPDSAVMRVIGSLVYT